MIIAKPNLKPLEWVGSSYDDFCALPQWATHKAGFELKKVQAGNTPTDWKPMPVVGFGACEIRVHYQTEHRVIYVAKFGARVYVLHAFEKKSQKTSQKDLELAKRRFKLAMKMAEEERQIAERKRSQ